MNQHPFTLTGLGQAPFSIQNKSSGNHSFFCEHCGRTLKNRFFVKSSDNKISVVGSVCIKKTSDQTLISELKELKLSVLKAERSAAINSRTQKSNEHEKTIFGGLTKSEKIQSLLSDKSKSFESLNQALEEESLLTIMDEYTNGNFFLHNDSSVNNLSPRTINFMKDVIVKSRTGGARKNSKAYKEAVPLVEADLNSFIVMFNGWAEKINTINNELSIIQNTKI